MSSAPLARLRGDGFARSAGAFLAMLALLLQLAVPLAHDPVGIGAFTPWLDAPLCHAGGASAEQTAPRQAPAQRDSGAHLCALCIALQACGAFIAPPASGGILAVSLPSAAPSFTATAPRVANAPEIAAQPRAPPLT